MNRTCQNCRHVRRTSVEDARKTLTQKAESGAEYTLASHPMIKTMLLHGEATQCGLIGAYVDPNYTCEHHSRPILGMGLRNMIRAKLTGVDEDAALRHRLRSEREQKRKDAEQREEASQFIARPLSDRPCDHCKRVHPRCLDCKTSRGACTLCPRCGYEMNVTAAPAFAWKAACKRCTCVIDGDSTVGVSPFTIAEWHEGRCDGCKHVLAVAKARADAEAKIVADRLEHEAAIAAVARQNDPILTDPLMVPGIQFRDTPPPTLTHESVDLVKP